MKKMNEVLTVVVALVAWCEVSEALRSHRSPFKPFRISLYPRHALPPHGGGTTGSVFDTTFLEAIAPFYSRDTATELMGPLMYSLFRSLRPAVTVELGAGYTTFWLAKAARDAMEEAAAERDACFDEEDLHRASWVLWDSAVGRGVVEEAAQQGTYTGTGALPAAAMRPYHPVFHCVDIFSDDAGSHFHQLRAALRILDSINLGTGLVDACHESNPSTDGKCHCVEGLSISQLL